MKDIYSMRDWREKIVAKRRHLGNAGRDLVMCMCADGVNPFGMDHPYSMELTGGYALNLPRQWRSLPQYCLLSGIVGGPKHPKTMQPYVLSLLIDILETQFGPGSVKVLSEAYFAIDAGSL